MTNHIVCPRFIHNRTTKSAFQSIFLSLALFWYFKGRVHSSNILRLQCRSNALFFHVGSNLKVNATALVTFSVQDVDECLGECLLHPTCASANLHFAVGTNTCYLYNQDRSSVGLSLVQEEGYHYYDTGKPSDKLGPYCRQNSNLCPNEKCIDTCDKLQKCVPLTGSSCNKIRINYRSATLKSGFFTVIVNGTSYEIYCDMETEGGGWILIGSVDFINSTNISTVHLATENEILQAAHVNYFPTKQGLFQLKRMFGFSQLRFYCHKQWSKKTIHIQLPTNKSGEAVLDFLTGENITAPLACGSFEILPDDNSELSRRCWEWGPIDKLNTWWSPSFQNHPFAISGQRHFGVFRERRECDDYKLIETSYNPHGVWRIYAR